MLPQADENEGASERRMSFFEHLEELRQRLKVVIAAFLVTFVAMLVLAIRPVDISGVTVYMPVPSLDQRITIPGQLITLLNESIVKGSANLTVLTPGEAFIASMKVAMFLAVVITSPISTYEFWRFVAPGLKQRERSLIIRITLPVVGLFLAGVLVSLLVVLPFTFTFLYSFASALGATALLDLDSFLDFVLWFSIAFGLAFELPVFMYALSYLGIVAPDFWKKNWRYATIGIFVFGAVVTPDGSGVTMLMVAIPMLFLYVAGHVAAAQRHKHAASQRSSPAKSS